MSVIYITVTIKKDTKNKNLIDELIREIRKHSAGHNNLVDLYSPYKDFKVYKSYLASGGVRAAILLKLSKQIYIPLIIVKKESPLGWNMSKYSANYLEKRILKVLKDIETKKYDSVKV